MSGVYHSGEKEWRVETQGKNFKYKKLKIDTAGYSG
jgi:hypothetical protein